MVFRFDTPTSIPTPPPVGTVGPEGFPTDGTGKDDGTIGYAYAMYMVIEEIRNVVVAAGLTPTKSNVTQLLQALRILAGPYPNGIYWLSANMILTPAQIGTLFIANYSENATPTLTLPPSATLLRGATISLGWYSSGITSVNVTTPDGKEVFLDGGAGATVTVNAGSTIDFVWDTNEWVGRRFK